MKTILKEVVPSKDYKKAGFFLIVDSKVNKKIPTIRCLGCFQHLSLAKVSILDGVLSGEVICPNDLYINSEIELSKKINKDLNVVYIK